MLTNRTVRLLLAALALSSPALVGLARADDPKSDKADTSRLDKLWDDLGSSDDVRLTRATLQLVAAGKEAAPFLRARLKPVKVDRKQVAEWIKQLDSDRFDEREKAMRELAYLHKYIKDDLQKALEGKPSLEVKKRVTSLLEQIPPEKGAAPPPRKPMIPRGSSIAISNINGEVTILIDGKPLDLTPRAPARPPGPPAEWQRAARAAVILEHIGSPEARQALEALAGGEKDALPTQAAAEALERLKK
jgi:hypothetical protein